MIGCNYDIKFDLNPNCPKRNKIKYSVYLVLKRIFDILFFVIGLICLSPVFLVVAIIIRTSDKGPAFYSHKRIGLNGKEIKIYKFRSMVKDSDNLDKWLNQKQKESLKNEFKVVNDPRITKFGHFLRKSSIDEIPQLFNVLIGNLSLIGPRPIVRKELENYGNCVNKLLCVKPGLTGYWQAYARNNVTYENGERQSMELYYIDHQSLWLDIKIFFKTIVTVINKDGAE